MGRNLIINLSSTPAFPILMQMRCRLHCPKTGATMIFIFSVNRARNAEHCYLIQIAEIKVKNYSE